MNKQFKMVDGVKVNDKIEWTDWTHNPITGCLHGCEWNMPDNSSAQCYAKSVAEGVAMKAYPGGFTAHHFYPERLNDPLKVKQPARIFLGSMTDVFGRWIPDEQVYAVLDACRRAHWHQFQLLTKNPVRIAKFANVMPPNVWLGASVPPSIMWNKPLSARVQKRMFERTIKALLDLIFVHALPNIIWLSLEPLSFDVVPTLRNIPSAKLIDWMVIGAASNGTKTYQPDAFWVTSILKYAAENKTPIFFKGNLKWEHRRSEFPAVDGFDG